LIEALRREGDEQASAVMRDSEAEAERLRNAAADRLGLLQEEHERQCQLRCAARRRDIVGKAEQEARLVRLRGEHALAVRLERTARVCLDTLREDNYAALFKGLVAELSGEEWATVWVNPADAELAGECFPRAGIVTDPAIVGGFAVQSGGGELTVVNTLEKRLERAWPDLLPSIVAELRGRKA
jgi:V/A-type H+-transporting ATPase subunit E